MKIGPVKSEFHFLLKESIKTRSHVVKMMVYIRKTDHKHCFGTNHLFHWDKFTKVGPVKSENHFLLKETVKTRSRMIKMKVYTRFYRKMSKTNRNISTKKKRGWFPHVFRVVWSCPGQVPDYFYDFFFGFAKSCFFSSQESPGPARTGPGRKKNRKTILELPAWPAGQAYPYTEFPFYGSI